LLISFYRSFTNDRLTKREIMDMRAIRSYRSEYSCLSRCWPAWPGAASNHRRIVTDESGRHAARRDSHRVRHGEGTQVVAVTDARGVPVLRLTPGE
jgi:hypothetical protein